MHLVFYDIIARVVLINTNFSYPADFMVCKPKLEPYQLAGWLWKKPNSNWTLESERV